MAEYWKSTPKYWCKHCKIFVRDTKLERSNHDATSKHQGNLKRFLRDLHRGHEKDEKDKGRAKSEVARLNGLVSGAGAGGSLSELAYGRGPAPSLPKPQATPSQRKQQLSQLAEMGISIPDEFREEIAMAGEWQVASERIVDPTEGGDKRPEAIGFGIRKRTAPAEEEGEAMEAKKRRWGSAYRTHPAADDDGDLEALLCNITRMGKDIAIIPEIKKEGKEIKVNIEEETEASVPAGHESAGHPWSDGVEKVAGIKREPSDGEVTLPITSTSPNTSIKHNGDDHGATGVIFKKRKAKNIRQK